MKALTKRSNFGLRPNFFAEDAFDGIFRELSVDRVLEDVFGSTVGARANVFSTETGSAIEIEAPGMSKSDFTIKVDGSSLTISAQSEKKGSAAANHREFHRRSFSRTFTLPEGVRPAEIKASYEAGILRVDVPSDSVPEKKTLTIDVT